MTVYRLSPVFVALLRTIDTRGLIAGSSIVEAVAQHHGSGFLPGLGGRLRAGVAKLTSGKFFGFLRHSFQDIGSRTKY